MRPVEFETPILVCDTCEDEIMRSELEGGKWIHVDDEFFVSKQGWKYDHDARPRYIDGTAEEEVHQ